jgi:hypothetical protein
MWHVLHPWHVAQTLHVACLLQAYFEGLGFEIPGHMNPADAYMDIIAGIIKPSTGAAVDIAACWRVRQQGHISGSPHGVQHSGRMIQATAADDMLDTAGLEGFDEGNAAVVAIAASRRVSGQDAPTDKVSQLPSNLKFKLQSAGERCIAISASTWHVLQLPLDCCPVAAY